MRNTLPYLSRPLQAGPHHERSASPSPADENSPQPIPSFRFISAAPSVANVSLSAAAPFASSPLAPRSTNEPSRKRLVPKKSKLGLLGGGKTKEKATKDLSDVVRRVGGDTPSTGRGGFEIYVDHTEDPDLSDIVVVKKKKSRIGLDGMSWGALGEVTNVPSAPKEKPSQENLLKVKSEDTQKWWSIGRGRKEEKNLEKERSKSPEPSKPADDRSRFNSLDATVTLSGAETKPRRQRSGTVSSLATLFSSSESTKASDDAGLLAAPSSGAGTGSIALRAMRSMRSLARMKSWANIGTSNNISDKEGNASIVTSLTTAPTTAHTNVMTSMTKEKKETRREKKKESEKENKEIKEKEKKPNKKLKDRAKTVRMSGSSFEAGALSSHEPSAGSEGTVKRKQSILGLGLPTTMRLGNGRVLSNASTTNSLARKPSISLPRKPSSIMGNRRTSESAHLVMGSNGRPASAASSGSSSLRPPSTASGYSSMRSPRSSSSSNASVRWDEAGLRNVKERQRRERQNRRESIEAQGSISHDSRRSSDGRRRIAIADIFPEVIQESPATSSLREEHPMVTVPEAAVENPEESTISIDTTPVKRARPRPMSEQMLGRARPKPMSDDSTGIISILDAATDDLACLINRLDLEATPASKKNSPLKRSPVSLRHMPSNASFGTPGDGSPCRTKFTFNKNADAPFLASLREQASTTSLRPYMHQKKSEQSVEASTTRQLAVGPAEARKLIGKPIVPRSSLDWQVSPKKATIRPKSTVRPRASIPAPALDSPTFFMPLRPASQNRISVIETVESLTPIQLHATANPSSQTFGSDQNVSAKVGREPSVIDYDEAPPPSPSPPFKRMNRHSRRSSVLSAICDSGAVLSVEAMKSLGLTGTLGGKEPEIDPEDPDSDIPDELQSILSGQSDDENVDAFDDTLSRHSPPPTPGLPPLLALPSPQSDAVEESSIPVFCANVFDEDAHEVDTDEGDESPAEDDTNRSFDFTGELRKLNFSGGSDRRSFVEQLENAFRTPARVDLGFTVGQDLFSPQVTPMGTSAPPSHRSTPGEDMVPQSVTKSDFGSFTFERSVDESEQSESYRDSATSDTLDRLLAECEDDFCRPYPGMQRDNASVRPKESDGKLNRSFKFGGKMSIPSTVDESFEKPLTLSDIIPPLSHQPTSETSMAEEDSSVIHSIMANAFEDDASVVKSILAQASDAVPEVQPRARVDSDTSSKRRVTQEIDLSGGSSHSRSASEASFTGFESFDEVRRAFEFGPNRPAFYPPPGATSRAWHGKNESINSIASVSSFGAVLNQGVRDPFGYAASRPTSYAMSTTMSTTVDDTFSFMKRKNVVRNRVDSDASSFYFQGARPTSWRIQGRDDSSFSAYANSPPISMYNRRSYFSAQRNDSSMSTQSFAPPGSYRPAWTRHRQEPSTDSAMSDFSVARLGRPGVGDKMFDMDYGMPLEAISASPAGSTFSSDSRRATSDSIFNSERQALVKDSLFEKAFLTASQRTSFSEDIFDLDRSYPQHDPHLYACQFRPLSMASTTSTHSAPRDDDTMISMIGGGHVRRRSIDSGIDRSPCHKRERKKTTALQHLAKVLRFDQYEDELPLAMPDRMSKVSSEPPSPEKAFNASPSPVKFGGVRMNKAQDGVLERHSLEESALMAQGEDFLNSLSNIQVFSRPVKAGRARSSTCTSSSGTDTPPLSVSDNSSISSGSQCSIDLAHLNVLLTNLTQPTGGIAGARARARGAGHRRPFSQIQGARSSVYETIEEESDVLSNSPSPVKLDVPNTTIPDVSCDSVFVVDADSAFMEEHWNPETGIVEMRRYIALREEVEETVTESKRVWEDTPFSVFALQSFQPPKDKTAMKELLEYSKENYGPLPSELRPHRRARTLSRPSPYPLRPRSVVSHDQSWSDLPGKSFATAQETESEASSASTSLREISINPQMTAVSPPETLDTNSCSSFLADLPPAQPEKLVLGPARPRVKSGARRAALGWSKRNTGKSNGKPSRSEDKENVAQGALTAPADSLRISRPRPRGRPTTSTVRRTVPV